MQRKKKWCNLQDSAAVDEPLASGGDVDGRRDELLELFHGHGIRQTTEFVVPRIQGFDRQRDGHGGGLQYGPQVVEVADSKAMNDGVVEADQIKSRERKNQWHDFLTSADFFFNFVEVVEPAAAEAAESSETTIACRKAAKRDNK